MGIPDTWSGFKATDCCVCGVGFAMESGLYDQRRKDHAQFYCPNGHGQHFAGKTDDEKRIAELERAVATAKADALSAQRAREWAEQRAKGANIAAGLAKGKLKRVHERLHAGVCPFCKRTFKQLAAHMASKHGDQE